MAFGLYFTLILSHIRREIRIDEKSNCFPQLVYW